MTSEAVSTSTSAAIYGCAGLSLSEDEKAFFTEVQPWGFILFARNCDTAEQIKALCAALRDCVKRDTAPILIDQEGGRVARLKPPLANLRPPMDRFGELLKLDPVAAKQTARLGARLMAEDLRTLGINVNCVPMIDVRQADADDIIGDRAFGCHPDIVTILGAEVVAGTLEGGVLPIIKHIPGHGRALCDSHLELPRVVAPKEDLQSIDFPPFKALSSAPLAMTAHVVYEAYDTAHCATLSRIVIEDVIRGEIGFDGMLMTDDLSMKALGGSFEDRAQQSIAAGCDMLLHCNGDMAEMKAVAAKAPLLTGKSLERAHAAIEMLRDIPTFDRDVEEARFARLLKPVTAWA